MAAIFGVQNDFINFAVKNDKFNVDPKYASHKAHFKTCIDYSLGLNLSFTITVSRVHTALGPDYPRTFCRIEKKATFYEEQSLHHGF